MAPVTPKSKSRQKQRMYLADASASASASAFSGSKRDKRAIKSSVFRSRIEKANARSTTKRRRPSKKLVATLESLADSLPEVASAQSGHPSSGAHSGKSSLRSRPGAKKQNERLDKDERSRFAKNIAVMQQSGPASSTGGSDVGTHRWAALRQHISSSVGSKGRNESG